MSLTPSFGLPDFTAGFRVGRMVKKTKKRRGNLSKKQADKANHSVWPALGAFALWILWGASVVISGWGNLKADLVLSDVPPFNNDDYEFASRVGAFGTIVSIIIFIAILVIECGYRKSKWIAWFVSALALVSFYTMCFEDMYGKGDKTLIYNIVTVVLINILVTLLPFIIIIALIVRATGNVFHVIFGKRK